MLRTQRQPGDPHSDTTCYSRTLRIDLPGPFLFDQHDLNHTAIASTFYSVTLSYPTFLRKRLVTLTYHRPVALSKAISLSPRGTIDGMSKLGDGQRYHHGHAQPLSQGITPQSDGAHRIQPHRHSEVTVVQSCHRKVAVYPDGHDLMLYRYTSLLHPSRVSAPASKQDARCVDVVAPDSLVERRALDRLCVNQGALT